MRGVLLTMTMLAAVLAPAMAQPLAEGLPAPNAMAPWPNCTATDAGGKPSMQPYAVDPSVYGGIYLAVEKRFAPLAPYFFPVLQVQDNRDWVRITRTTRGGARPPERLTISGSNHNLLGEAGVVPVIMKIDKCSGAVLEMSFDKDKLTGGGAPTPLAKGASKPALANTVANKPAPPLANKVATRPVAANKPVPPAAVKPVASKPADKRVASKPADKHVASKPVARKSVADNSAARMPAVPKTAVPQTAKEDRFGGPSANDMADQMIRMFGREAEGQARENAASHARAGDSAGQGLWLAVADIISDRTYGHGRTGTR